MHHSLARAALAITLLAPLVIPAAQAADFTISGSFVQDDDVLIIPFTVDIASTVTLDTTSYAAGGFDPVLTLFLANGTILDVSDDINPPTELDARIVRDFDPGLYFLGLTQSDNFAIGPRRSDGFLRQGEGNFTGGPFLDGFGNQRTGAYTVNLRNVGSLAVAPEPNALALLALGISGGAMFAQRRAR